MKRKPNITQWYLLGLAAILVVGCLTMAAGTTFARYRDEIVKIIPFQVRQPNEVYLGTLEYSAYSGRDGMFVQSKETRWQEFDGDLMLSFAVGNGKDEEEFAAADQKIQVRLIGSIGAWYPNGPMKMLLKVPKASEPEGFQVLEATPIRISQESPLYETFGDGWLFCFLDEAGREYSWTLEGGKLSYITMDLTFENADLVDTSLLQLQVNGIGSGG